MTNSLFVPPEPGPLSALQPIDKLIGLVADFIGGSDDPEARQRALDCLDQAAGHLNLIGVYLFRRKLVTYTSSAVGGGDFTITTDDQTLEMPTDWGWADDIPVCYGDDGTVVSTAGEWLPWDVFVRASGDRSGTGVPRYFSVRSEYDDVIQVLPSISTSATGKIEVAYFARIQLPSEAEGADVYLTPESRQALLEGGKAFVMQYRYQHAPQVWMPFWSIFMQTITKARAAAHRMQDQHHTFAVPDEVGRMETDPSVGVPGAGPIYLKLG